jgi:hypothetical protein
VYYHDPDQKYPGTKEKPGYWLGVADHVRDRLCFHIMTTDTHHIIERSVVRSAERSPINATLTFPLDDMQPNPGQIDANDETVTIIDDEELVDRGELEERGDHDATANPGTDDHSVATDVQHNRSTQPRCTNLRTPKYTYVPAVEHNDSRINAPVEDTPLEQSPCDSTLRYYTVSSNIVRILTMIDRHRMRIHRITASS